MGSQYRYMTLQPWIISELTRSKIIWFDGQNHQVSPKFLVWFSEIFFGNFKRFPRKSQMSFSLILKTFADIAAQLVTQTINWQVLGNKTIFLGILLYFFWMITLSRMFPLLTRKCKNFENTLLLFGYSIPRLLGNFKEM